MGNEIYGNYYSDEQISEMPCSRIEQGVVVVSLPEGNEAYVAPRYSENGNGWWGTTYQGEEIQEVYLFEDIEGALAEINGENG